jgi:hypothetical protein
MQLEGRTETNSFKFTFVTRIRLLIAGFDMPFATNAQGYSTNGLIKFFDLPIQARADGALTDLGPLRARRAGNIHVEGKRVLIHEISAHAK